MLLITNGEKLKKLLYIYIQVRNAIIFQSLVLNNNTDSQATMAQSGRSCECCANGPRFKPKPLPALWSHLGSQL